MIRDIRELVETLQQAKQLHHSEQEPYFRQILGLLKGLEMKIWSVKFTGIYPVGAVAIVCTYDSETKEDAETKFAQLWKDMGHTIDPQPEVELLNMEPGTVTILLDGNY